MYFELFPIEGISVSLFGEFLNAYKTRPLSTNRVSFDPLKNKEIPWVLHIRGGDNFEMTA